MGNVSMIDGHIDEPRMTDNEIIKALSICGNFGACTECPLDDLGGIDKCMHTLILNALDLINRQKAEIERLEIALKNEEAQSTVFFRQTKELREENVKLHTIISKMINTAKAEAIKEFEERFSNAIDEKIDDSIRAINPHLYITKIIASDLVKEMVGDAE